MSEVPKGLAATGFMVIILWAIAEARSFFIPLSMAALLAFLMAPVVRMMLRFRFPEWSAVIVSVVLLMLPVASFFSILIWQAQALAKDAPLMIESINRALFSLAHSSWGEKLNLQSELDTSVILKWLEGGIGQGVQFLLESAKTIVGAGSQLALVLLFAVLMVASRNQLRRTAEKIIMPNRPGKAAEVLDEVSALIERFLVFRLLIVVLIAAIDTLLLSLFRVPYALLMGGLLGVLTLVPAIGYFLGVVPPVIVAIAIGMSAAKLVILLVLLTVVAMIEGNILTPKMVGRRLNINVLATFVGLFGGGLIWGIWGMLLSIPILGILRIVLSAAPSMSAWGEFLADKEVKPLKPGHRN